MVAVQWPQSICECSSLHFGGSISDTLQTPYFQIPPGPLSHSVSGPCQAAAASLDHISSTDVSLIQGNDPISKRWNPLQANFTLPSEFSGQLSDSTSPIHMDLNTPNELFMFPDGHSSGMPNFAAAVGLRPQDLFGTCLSLFLMIVGASIAITAILTAVDWLGTTFCGSASHGYSADRKDATDVDGMLCFLHEPPKTATNNRLDSTSALVEASYRTKFLSWKHSPRESRPPPHSFSLSYHNLLVLSTHARLLRRLSHLQSSCGTVVRRAVGSHPCVVVVPRRHYID
jgi:hypothetical protein